MFNKLIFKLAVKIIKNRLKNDNDLYRSYKDNIAISIQDTFYNEGYRHDDLNELSNKAANHFLTIFTKYT